MTKAERIIDFQMLDVLVEATISTINDELASEIEAYRGYINQKTAISAKNFIKAPNKAD